MAENQHFVPLRVGGKIHWDPIVHRLQSGPYDCYKWSYGAPMNGFINGVITLLIGVITRFITGWSPKVILKAGIYDRYASHILR